MEPPLPARVAARLRSLQPLEGFDSRDLELLQNELRLVHLPAGETLIRQGEPGDSMYLLLEGSLQVVLALPGGEEQLIDELEAGASVGEMALLTGQPRAASVVTAEECELVELSGAAFQRLSERNPAAMLRFAQAMAPRLRRTQLAAVLGAYFGRLSRSELHELQGALEWRQLNSGEVLFRQGDPGEDMYIVVSGRLAAVVEQRDGGKTAAGELGRGDSAGEFALITGEPRATTVYATRDSDLVRLSRGAFETLAARYPQLTLQILRSIARRAPERGAGRGPKQARRSTFAIIPVGAVEDLGAFARRLAQELAAFGTVLHLSGERLDRLLGRPGIAQTPDEHPARVALVSWLDEQETKYSYIVYEADARWSTWTARALRQADRVLIVGQAGARAAPGEIETRAAELGLVPRKELVLLHAAQTRQPSGTAAWLGQRDVSAHHHVRLAVDGDMRRLARRLTGRAIGLVLGGGGARGYAHVGAIKAIHEVGLEIDLVGGTSVGALFGGLYAIRGHPAVLDRAVQHLRSRRKMMDFTLPVVSVLNGRKTLAMVRAFYGDLQIEDLWRPFFCVSSNLRHAVPVVHRRGPLWRSIRASGSIPGIVPPVVADGALLIDGGAMNNLPIDVMHELAEGGPVIAVNVSPKEDLALDYNTGPSLSGWQVMWSRFNPRAAGIQAPSLLTIFMRSAGLLETYSRQARFGLADLLIEPPVGQIGILDLERYEEGIAAGYRTALPLLREWAARRAAAVDQEEA